MTQISLVMLQDGDPYHVPTPDAPCGFCNYAICLRMLQDRECMNNFTYDFVVKARPDLVSLRPFPDASTLPEDTTIVNPYYEHWTDVLRSVAFWSKVQRGYFNN